MALLTPDTNILPYLFWNSLQLSPLKFLISSFCLLNVAMSHIHGCNRCYFCGEGQRS